MDIADVGAVLSNPTRVNLLQLLTEKNYGASEAHETYNRVFEEEKHRESIYRELEKLVDIGLIEKDYSQSEKQLIYSLPYDSIEIIFKNNEVNMK